MEKDITLFFQTTSEINNALEKIARKECRSVSSVIESIICHYLEEDNESKGIHQNRRRFERKKVELPAFVGDPKWQRREFEEGTIHDISFGGIRLSVPKGSKIEIQNDADPKEIKVVLLLADCLWPIHLKCRIQRVSEFGDEVQMGASLVDPDVHTYTALQRYVI